MNCYLFTDEASAQSAADSIWSTIAPETKDVNAATGQNEGAITTSWASPMQRATDGKWWIPVCDAVPNAQGWPVDTWDEAWANQVEAS